MTLNLIWGLYYDHALISLCVYFSDVSVNCMQFYKFNKKMYLTTFFLYFKVLPDTLRLRIQITSNYFFYLQTKITFEIACRVFCSKALKLKYISWKMFYSNQDMSLCVWRLNNLYKWWTTIYLRRKLFLDAKYNHDNKHWGKEKQ